MANYCSVCGKKAYSSFCVTHKPRKRIAQKGKRTLEYELWRDEVAIPYLDAKYGRICALCHGVRCKNKMLDVDHIRNRSTNPKLKMDLSNVQLVGRYPCHVEKTSA